MINNNWWVWGDTRASVRADKLCLHYLGLTFHGYRTYGIRKDLSIRESIVQQGWWVAWFGREQAETLEWQLSACSSSWSTLASVGGTRRAISLCNGEFSFASPKFGCYLLSRGRVNAFSVSHRRKRALHVKCKGWKTMWPRLFNQS